jgi:deaminated glutathione amidase
MWAAAVQLNSTQDRARNLAAAERLTRSAADDGASLVLLPERVDVRGGHEDYVRNAAPIGDHPTVEWARELARELGIDLVAGSISERREGRDKLANASVHVGPDGSVRAVYRKIHLFDVQVGDIEYLESASDEGGDEIVVTELADGTRAGLSICYDLRFPELYRIMAVRGARVLLVPANFTHPTGSAHWEVLLRARAIEDQAFVVAAGQVGEHPGDMGRMYGNSLIADPWGQILARADDASETYVIADLDYAGQDEVRAKLPSLAGRVPGAYRWPEGATV